MRDPAASVGAGGLAPGEAVPGELTGVSLCDVRRLCLPPAPDPFGRLRPPPDRAALRLSLELAYMTYTFELEPWMRAGWTDISIQVDNRLQSGVTVGESESAGSERMRGLMNGWKVARARMAMREANPLAQLIGALRQREKSDTIKAVTMLHPAGSGRYVVAIGFMGTGPRFYDWFSNFRLTTEAGFHKGFSQLTDAFEQSAARIRFPDTAAALGLPTLTLSDVLDEMRAPDSRFSLWMAGHSQGAAVMQVFCHRLLARRGVNARHVLGYGFASPTVAAAAPGLDPAACPLYHVINSDDLVPRVGAIAHLGMGLRFQADAALRAAAYGWEEGGPDEAALRERAGALFARVTDTPAMLETMVALLNVIHEEKAADSLAALMDKRWAIAPLDRAFAFAEGKAEHSVAHMSRYARVAYLALTGSPMDGAAVAALMETMRPAVREVPLVQLLTLLRDRYYPPHMLRRGHGQPGAYGYIVREGWARLTPFLWESDAGGELHTHFAPQYARFTPDADEGCAPSVRRPARQPAQAATRRRSRRPERAKPRSCRRPGLAARRRVLHASQALPTAITATAAQRAGAPAGETEGVNRVTRVLRGLQGWRPHLRRATAVAEDGPRG